MWAQQLMIVSTARCRRRGLGQGRRKGAYQGVKKQSDRNHGKDRNDGPSLERLAIRLPF
jgi:hypothetical protein